MATKELLIRISSSFSGGGLKQASGDLGNLGRVSKDLGLQQAIMSEKAALAAKKQRELAQEVLRGSKSFDAASKELAEYNKKLGMTTESGGRFGGMLTGLVTGGALLALGKQMLDFGEASVATASDIEEAASKFQYTFGPAAESVGGELDDFAESANRSRFELRAMAADVGALTESTLGSKEAAGDMAVAISKLAVDLASFHNVAEDEALTALKAGLIGEAEPMRRFGVLLSEAAVQNHILSTNMAASKAEITDAMKMQARFNIVMAQTSTAQGDAIRTSDSYANVSRGLEAAIQELSAAVGENLIPSMTKAKSTATDVISGLAGFAAANNALRTAVADGIITQAEANRMTDRMALTSMDAADVVRVLKEEYQRHNIALEEASAEAAGADKIFENYTTTLEEHVRFLGPVIGFNQKTGLSMRGLSDEYRAALRVLGEHSPALSQDTRELEEAAYASGQLGNAQARLKGYLEADSAAMKEQEEAAKKAADALAAYVAHSGDLAVQALRSDEGLGFFNETLDEVGTRMVATGGLTAQQTADLERMQGAYSKAAQTVRDYELGVKGANLTDDARNKKIEEQQGIMAALEQNMQPLLSVSSELTAVTQGLTVNQEAVAQALIGAADAAGMDAETIIGLGLAYGTLSETQAEYLLKQIAIQQEAEYLISIMREQGLTFDDVKQRMDSFIAGLDGTAQSAASSAASVRGLRSDIDSLQNKEITVTVNQVNRMHDEFTVPEGHTPGGGGRAAGGLITGGVPGRDSVPSLLMPGEYVLRKTAVDRLGLSALNQMNQGMTRFATGGLVPNFNGMYAARGTAVSPAAAGFTDQSQINIYAQTKEAAALAMATVAERRRKNLDTYMGVG